VVEFVKSEEYARFTRIVFDTAPTGHTLRLLSVPDFVEASLGKLIRLRKKLTAAGDAVRGLFGVTNQDAAIQKLEDLRVSCSDVNRRELLDWWSSSGFADKCLISCRVIIVLMNAEDLQMSLCKTCR
jgi:anion-transporting  ArsA/GET3 family ATPase